MEKLIDLLNEREKELSPSVQVEWTEFSVGINKWYLISKEFGFIERLVKKDKIDYEKIEKQTKCKNIVGGKEFLDFDIERDFNPYEEVLMWLAIQDEPIRFLCEILK